MKNKIKKYVKEGVLLVLFLIIAMNGLSFYKSLDLNKEKLDTNSFILLDGSEYKLVKDKPLVIHFWATWCPICEVEAPNIQKLSEDFEVITIAVQSGTKNEIQEYLDKQKLNFKVVNDEDGYHSRKFNIKAFPTTFIYDKNRDLKFSEVGYTSTIGLYARVLFSR
jgi:thiol-disulfide isomerase/thioredoxin